MSNIENQLVYVWDAYCGWCYGFSENLRKLHESHPELKLSVVSGGLFTAEKRLLISDFTHIPIANERISQITGVKFGSKYNELLNEGSFILDSEAAARGLVALKKFAPERVYYLAADMQTAFYNEGKSLSDLETYLDIARKNNIDEALVKEYFESDASLKEVHADFEKTQNLQIHSFPTLLIKTGEKYVQIGGGGMTAEKMEERMMKVLE